MLRSGECNPLEKATRNNLVGAFRVETQEVLLEETGCRRKCSNRRYRISSAVTVYRKHFAAQNYIVQRAFLIFPPKGFYRRNV